MSRPANTDLLVRVARWGQVSILEADGGVVEVQRLAIDGGDADVVAGLADDWRAFQSPALTPILGAIAAVGNAGQVVEVRRTAPSGSTLAELVAAHGVMDGVLVAGLFVELVSDVRRLHQRGLVHGSLAPSNLYVCPPGVSGAAAVTAHQGGLAAMVAAATGALGNAEDPGFSQLYTELACVPPELADGQVPDAATDTYMLCASLAFALLGGHVHEGADAWALRDRARAGVLPETIEALEEAAPGIGRLLARGLSVQPLLRRGLLGELSSFFASLLGAPRLAKVVVGKGGDPWGMGSPLIPLAAYVRARPYAERFSAEKQAHSRRASASRERPLIAGAMGTGDGDLASAPVDEARISAAIAELKILRARAERSEQKRRTSPIVQAIVIAITIAVAWAIAWIGFRQTQTHAPPPPRPGYYKGKKLPKPPEPRVLYTTPKPE